MKQYSVLNKTKLNQNIGVVFPYDLFDDVLEQAVDSSLRTTKNSATEELTPWEQNPIRKNSLSPDQKQHSPKKLYPHRVLNTTIDYSLNALSMTNRSKSPSLFYEKQFSRHMKEYPHPQVNRNQFKIKLKALFDSTDQKNQEFKKLGHSQQMCRQKSPPFFSTSLYRCDYESLNSQKGIKDHQNKYHEKLQKFLKIKQKLRKKNSILVMQMKNQLSQQQTNSLKQYPLKEESSKMTQADRQKARKKIKFRKKQLIIKELSQRPTILFDIIPQNKVQHIQRQFHTSVARRINEKRNSMTNQKPRLTLKIQH